MKKRLKNILFSIITSCALLLNYKAIYDDVLSIRDPFVLNIFITGLITIFLFIFYEKQKVHKLHWTKYVLSILFSLFMIFGNSYKLTDSWNLVFGNLIMIMVSIISFVGYLILFIMLFNCLDNILKSKIIKDKINNNKLNNILLKLDEKPFISSLILILIFWLIYIIAFYPAILSKDPSFQILQFFNVHTKYADYVIRPVENVYLTNHHPVLHTLLLGSFIKFGRLFGSDNLGLLFYSIFQTVILASALACTISFLKKNNVSLKTRAIVLLIYMLVPMFPFYAMSCVKDTIYTALIIFYVMFMIDFIKNKKDKKISIKETLAMILNILLIMMFRNNGIYVIILSLPFLLLLSKTNVFRILLILIISVGCYECYEKVILPHYGIAPGSIREVLSIPFQQTARYVKEHDKELSKGDIRAIDKVLVYDTLKERYNPRLSDSVKNEYNKYATKDDLKNYFKVWKDGLNRHPTTYVQATMNNIYGYFYPGDTNWYIYTKYEDIITESGIVDYHYNNLNVLRKVLSGYGISFPYIPLVGLISNIGFNTWLLLIMLAYYIEDKKYENIIFLSPMLVTLLICIASPANTYFRYTMPYVFAMPLLISIFIKEKEECKDEKK